VNALPSLIGVGIYTISEAAHLAEVATARARGWMQGYGQGGGKPRRQAVIGHELRGLDALRPIFDNRPRQAAAGLASRSATPPAFQFSERPIIAEIA
jgi:hypothetical protein